MPGKVGRPRKYKTAEERRAADCIKSDRYYQRYGPLNDVYTYILRLPSKKKLISRRRHDKYLAAHTPSAAQNKGAPSSVNSQLTPQPPKYVLV